MSPVLTHAHPAWIACYGTYYVALATDHDAITILIYTSTRAGYSGNCWENRLLRLVHKNKNKHEVATVNIVLLV